MFDQCLYFNTTSLGRQLERLWSQAFAPFGLTPPQAFMLRAVLERGVMSPTELAATLNISKATCTRTVDGLVRLGLLERTVGGEDARYKDLRATTEGEKLKLDLNQASAEVTRRLKRVLGTDEFSSVVGRIREIAETIGP